MSKPWERDWGDSPSKPWERNWDGAVEAPPAQERTHPAVRAVRDLAVGGLKSAVALPQSAVGLADIVSGGRVGKLLENEGGSVGFRPNEAQAELETWYSPETQAARRKVQEAEGFVDTAKTMVQNPSSIATGVIESVAPMLAGGAIGRGVMAVAPRVGATGAAAAGEGSVMAGQAAENIRARTDDGLLSPEQAAAALATGAGGALLARLGGAASNRLGVGDIDTAIVQGVGQSAKRGVLARTAIGAGVEGGLEEMPQSAMEQALQNVALDKPIGEGVGSAAAQGLLTGAPFGAVGANVSAGKAAAPAESTLDDLVGQVEQGVQQFLGATEPVEGLIGSIMSGSSDSIDESIGAALEASSTVPEVARKLGVALQPMVDRAVGLTEQANAGPTEADRALALDQLQTGAEMRSTREVRAEDFADLAPMDLRTAKGRLTVLRDQVAQEGGDALTLAVVPHPGTPGRYAISRVGALPSLQLDGPTETRQFQIARQAADQQALGDASVEGAFTEARGSFEYKLKQQALTRALQSVEARNGVASAEDAALLDSAYPGQKLYDSVQGQAPVATPAAPAQREAIATARAQLIQQRMDRAAGVPTETITTTSALAPQIAVADGVFQRTPGRENRLERLAGSVEMTSTPALQAPTSPGASQEAVEGLDANAPLARARPGDKAPTSTAGLSLAPLDTPQQTDLLFAEQREPGARLQYTHAESRLVDVATLPAQSAAAQGQLSRQQHRFLKSLASLFGQKIEVFESDREDAPDGYVRSGDARTIYINARSQQAHLVVFGHELLHQIKATNPKAYEAIRNVVRVRTGADLNVPGINGDMEEVTADLVGNLFSDTSFWTDVFGQISRPEAVRLGDLIAQTVARFTRAMGGMRGFDTDKVIEDLQGVRQAAAGALAQYAREQLKRPTKEEAEGVKPAEKRTWAGFGSPEDYQASQAEGRAQSARMGDAWKRVKEGWPKRVPAPAKSSVDSTAPSVGYSSRSWGGYATQEEYQAALRQRGISFTEKRKETDDGQPAADAGRQQPGVAEKQRSAPAHGTAREGALPPVTAWHFSQEARPALSSAAYGQGLKGSGRETFLNAGDSRRRHRIYFYVDQGAGIHPESGVGGAAHEVSLRNVYDGDEDALGLKKGGAFESAVLDAGFDGYLYRIHNKSAAVVLMGPRSVPVAYRGLGAKATTPGGGMSVKEEQPIAWDTQSSGPAQAMETKAAKLRDSATWKDFDVRVTPAINGFAKVETRKKLPILNVGLSTRELKGGGQLNEDAVRQALEGMGVQVAELVVHESDTEPTAVVTIGRQLTPDEGNTLAEDLSQQAIVQRLPDGSGDLYGPMTEEWGPYNPEYFVMPDGRKASDPEKLSEKREPWYSALHREVSSSSTNAAPAAGWKAAIKGWVSTGKVKADEVAWSGLEEWLDLQQGKVTKAQVSEFLSTNGVKVTETVLGNGGLTDGEAQELRELEALKRRAESGEDGAISDDEVDRFIELGTKAGNGPITKFGNYTLPGGTNYREVLLTLPVEEEDTGVDVTENGVTTQPKPLPRFVSGHWENIPNVLAHIRLNDRTDASGARVLFVEEIQSDWGQAGKKQGFGDKEPKTGKLVQGEARVGGGHWWSVEFDDGTRSAGYGSQAAAARALEERRMDGRHGVPTAPFVDKTDKWVALAMKRVIKMAVDGGYDKVAFVTGEQSAERYDLSKQIDAIDYTKHGDGAISLHLIKAGDILTTKTVKPEELEENVGKDMAAKILAGDGALQKPRNGGLAMTRLEGLDLKVGGEGMRAFYDKIVPSVAKDVLKKLGGGALETVSLSTVKTGNVMDAAGKVVARDVTMADFMDKWGDEFSFRTNQGDRSTEQPAFTITDSMKAKASGGMPLFSAKRQQLNPDIVATLGRHIRSLLPAERAKLRRDSAQRLIDHLRQLPSANEMAAVAWAGRAKRGWYFNSAVAIEHVFGPDAPRFAALLAAMSPQTSVELNLLNALRTWKNWTQAGRPTSPEEILQIMGRSVPGHKGDKSVLHAWFNNSVRALASEDPSSVVLSGPKVNSFMLNLRGYVEEVTNDAWMANYALVDQDIFGGKLTKGGDPGKGTGYLAMSARVREAAAVLTRLTGEEWAPSEVQETVWSWAKALYETASIDVPAEELVQNEAITAEMLQSTPDFRTLFHDQVNEQLLRDAGLGSRVRSLRRRGDLAPAGGQVAGADSETAPFDRHAQEAYEVRAARRLDELRALGRPAGPKFSEKRITDTPEFKRWFGGSKVVDENGEPLVVYHGTGADFTVFDGNAEPNTYESDGGKFFFTSDPADASGYAETAPGSPNAMPVYLSLQNPRVETTDLDPADWWDRQPGRVWGMNVAARGHDGLVVRGTGGKMLVVASRPEQIKSAIGNDGSFDADDPDITSSAKRNVFGNPINSAWTLPDDDQKTRFVYTVQDKMVDLKDAVAQVTASSQGLADEFNAAEKETLYHGRAAKRTKDLLDLEMQPLLKEMGRLGIELDDLETYLHNRHAEERNIQVASLQGGMADGGSNITTADARRQLAQYSPQEIRVFESLAARVDAITKGTRDILAAEGLEKPATLDAWESAYKHYVPLNRTEYESIEGTGAGLGFSIRGPASRRAMGSDKPVSNILANIARQREAALVRAEKNHVGKALFGMLAKNPNPDLALPVSPKFWERDLNDIVLQLIELGLDVQDATNIAQEEKQRMLQGNAILWRVNPALRGHDNVLALRVNGEDHYIFFNKQNERAVRLARSLKNLDVPQLGQIMSMIGSGTRWLSMVNTQYNPVFGIFNLMRDSGAALVNLTSTPLAGSQAEVAKHVMPALRGIYADLRAHRAGKQPSSAYAQLFEEFQRAGGQTGYRDLFATPADRQDALRRTLDPSSWAETDWGRYVTAGGRLKAPLEALRRAGAPFMHWLSDYNETLENAWRLSAYKVARDHGMTEQQAAVLAKNLTVNFNTKGEIATQAGALYGFFNAAVQGSARLLETLRGPAGKRILAGGLLLGALQAALLAAAGFDDDEPPEFVRDRSFIIPLGDGKYLSMPLPLGLHALPATARRTIEFVSRGFKDPAGYLAGMLELYLDAFNPIGGGDDLVASLTPSVADPAVALARNRDWTGKPIAKEDMSSLSPTPGHTRARDSSTFWARGISEFLNWSTGGTDYVPGRFSPTPDQIDYLVGQAFGGVAREAGKLNQMAESAITGEDLPTYKIPLAGRLYGNVNEAAAERGRYFDTLRQLNMHDAEIRGRRQSGKGSTVADYLKDNPEARLIARARDVERDVQALQKRRRALLERDGSPETLRLIDENIRRKMKLLNDRVRALEQ